MQHYLLLSRNLIYTGLTRAKQLAIASRPARQVPECIRAKLSQVAPQVIVVGSSKAIGLAVKKHEVGQRYTRLQERLKV
jgi:exodeoxyribonuclease V alpha subunit